MRYVGKLIPRRSAFFQLLKTICKPTCVHAAPLEIGNQRAQPLCKTGGAAFRRRAVNGQVFLFRFDNSGEDHAPTAFIQQNLLRKARALKYPALQSARGQHVNQKRAPQLQTVHDLKLRLQRILRGHEQHAALPFRHKPADLLHNGRNQPVWSSCHQAHALHSFPLFHVKQCGRCP